MAMTKALNTPAGTLNYTFITGEGRENLSGVAQYSTQLVLNEKDAAPLIAEIEAVWAASGIKKDPKSMGYKTLDDGDVAFNAKTAVDGKFGRTKVKTYDGKGKEFDLGNTLIGNNTVGKLGITLSTYEQGPNAGVTIYLNKVQIIKLEEYQGGGESFGDEGGYEARTEFEAPTQGEAPTYAPKKF